MEDDEVDFKNSDQEDRVDKPPRNSRDLLLFPLLLFIFLLLLLLLLLLLPLPLLHSRDAKSPHISNKNCAGEAT